MILSPAAADLHQHSGYKNQTFAAATSNHDFLAQIPLSPKQDSDCNLSDLSSSNWSAPISTKLDYEVAHERHKLIIPTLDLTNLPPDSDDERPSEPFKKETEVVRQVDLNPMDIQRMTTQQASH